MTNAVTNDPRSTAPIGRLPCSEPGAARADLRDARPRPTTASGPTRARCKLSGRRALITGGDSGIGRAVAIAFAREGADVAITHLPEEQADADETLRWVTEAGAKALDLAGDLRDEDVLRRDRRADGRGVRRARHPGAERRLSEGPRRRSRASRPSELDRVFRTNLYAPVFTARAAVPHLAPGRPSS